MKRILFFSLLPLIGIIIILNRICLLLDYLFFPGFRKTEIKSSLFITGMMRSGTTLLYNTLYDDRGRFTAMKLWEILFAPSIIQKKIFIFIAKIDSISGNILRRIISGLESKLFSQLSNLHRISFFNIEEDELLLLNLLATTFLIFLVPKNKSIRSFTRFDQSLSLSRKKKIMDFYKNCIKRHLYTEGTDKIYLGKCPSHTSKILSLKTNFPDCNIIFMYRDPFQAIRSSSGFLKRMSTFFQTPVNHDHIENDVIDVAKNWYEHVRSSNLKASSSLVIVVDYSDLIKNVETVICLLYKKVNLEINAFYLNTLHEKKEIRFTRGEVYPDLRVAHQELQTKFSEIVEYFNSISIK